MSYKADGLGSDGLVREPVRRPAGGRVAAACRPIGVSAVERIRGDLAPYRYTARRVLGSKLLLLLTDLAALWLAFFLGRAAAWFTSDISFTDSLTIWWQHSGLVRVSLFAALSTGIVLWFWGALGHYVRFKPYWDEVREILFVVLAGFCIDAMLVFLGKWDFSRLWLLTTWAIALVLLPFARLLVKRWINRLGWVCQPYVIIGCGPEVMEAVAAFASEPLMGFRAIAAICPRDTCDGHSRFVVQAEKTLPVYALDSELEAFLKTYAGLHIVIVLDNNSSEALKALAQRLALERDDVFIIPPMGGLPLYGMELSHFFSHEVLLLRARNNLRRRAPRFFKRAVDLVAAMALCILLLPLLLAIAALIKRESNGPVFFTQSRIGRNGRPFSFIKFRSMVVDADAALLRWKQSHPELWQRYRANNFKLADDPRITSVGRWIRRTSIDELPQLWNVLRGDMSLVGPRPLLARELPDYGESIAIYNATRPGLTGLWQISGRSSTTFEQRIAMDRWYIRNWSLWYDFVILVRTVRVVLKGEGAH